MRPFRRYREREIAPDEIFLDASNIPAFDRERMEGRLEEPLSARAFWGLGGLVTVMLLILAGQSMHLQVMKGKAYAAQSERNTLSPEVIFAPRGAITDRRGEPLVSNEATEEGFTRRVYASPGFAHLLGYVSYPKKDSSGNYYETEIQGMAGVESAHDAELAGKNGRLLVEEDALGEVISQGMTEPAIPGETLTLSIDKRVQSAFYRAIADLAGRTPFEGGSGVLMDATTGEIHALVSYPEYDPNVLSKGEPADVIAGYATDARRPYVDRAVSGLYTPGSIVKPMVAAGAITDGIISEYKTIYSDGALEYPNPYDPEHPTIFKDWKAHGALDMRGAIAHSGDVYFYTVGGGFAGQKGLGIERLKHWFHTFGFDTATKVDLGAEASGFIPDPEWKQETFGEAWNIGNTFHTAIGQYSMQITPLEAARAVAAIANGGKLLRPTVVAGQSPIGESMNISAEGLKIAREGMRLGVTEGTSIGLNDLSYVRAAGKTGTAQLGANNEYYNMWAVGFWPYDNPKYVYVVVMERGPAGTATGGIYVMHQILRELRETAPEYFGIEESQ
ncbi:MAG: hypothetical protein KBC38_03105 [Candidatus Pacebacteria bacterium]|nr:hypothetical protein [Candidatus Paceibacterota bacterium]MBP9840601.1 hypothetical protein [Candidatus Paceibacterota bacterium]